MIVNKVAVTSFFGIHNFVYRNILCMDNRKVCYFSIVPFVLVNSFDFGFAVQINNFMNFKKCLGSTPSLGFGHGIKVARSAMGYLAMSDELKKRS